MITVHHLANSRSQRVLWLLDELDVPYEVKRYERDPKTQLAPAELLQVHPLGKSPVITDDGVTVAETGAILEHLLERFGHDRLQPAPGTPEAHRYRYWMHFAEGSAMPYQVMKLVFDRIPKAPMPFFAKPIADAISENVLKMLIRPTLTRQLDYLESELVQREWFAGDAFTAADVMMSFPLEASAASGDLATRPRLADFVRRVQARPAYQRALKRGGEYAFARPAPAPNA